MSVIQGQQEQTIYNGFILNDTHRACEEVRVILVGIQNAVGLNTDQSFDVHIILNELLQNAIRHGCSIQQNKVYMNVCISGKDMLSITVKDNGKGFDVFKTLEQPQKKQVCHWSELSENGRGLQIVKNLCDDMVFSQKGNCVTVRKKLC